ncbi:hypothetical protein I3842_16G085400 [Carya illinoinensis]|uniref:Uncharacterized protein n=1 Tax=Carya illinoinensis TaxID=32201 RepID=A0A922D978_CARIL|nr:hypothetical protein I3842_16G085400 [Carya illinoinensis]
MAAEQVGKISEAYPMKGGDGAYSYANNSSNQLMKLLLLSFWRGVIDTAKKLITDAIAEKLDFNSIVLSNTFRIADLGCSVGPNTIRSSAALFTSIPPDRQYYAAGVAGSFHSRLFPNASLHFVHSSNAIFWLSRVPKSVVDKSSHSWNKERIHISDSEVECFLHARAQEVACGGLIALITTGRPNGALYSQTLQSITYDLLGSCLMDMAKRVGNAKIVREEEVDSFNVPTYFMSPQELVAVVNRNGEFSIERMENLPQVKEVSNLPESQILASHLRAAMDGLIKEHFGDVILDELCELFRKKVEEELPLIKSGRYIDFFALR